MDGNRGVQRNHNCAPVSEIFTAKPGTLILDVNSRFGVVPVIEFVLDPYED